MWCYIIGIPPKLRLEEFYSYTEKINKKDKENKTKQRKTMYSEQLYTITIIIDTQQINSSGTAYLFIV